MVRHAELQRTHALLQQQMASLTAERDALRSQLHAARSRLDALIERLPPEPAAERADEDEEDDFLIDGPTPEKA